MKVVSSMNMDNPAFYRMPLMHPTLEIFFNISTSPQDFKFRKSHYMPDGLKTIHPYTSPRSSTLPLSPFHPHTTSFKI